MVISWFVFDAGSIARRGPIGVDPGNGFWHLAHFSRLSSAGLIATLVKCEGIFLAIYVLTAPTEPFAEFLAFSKSYSVRPRGQIDNSRVKLIWCFRMELIPEKPPQNGNFLMLSDPQTRFSRAEYSF